MFVGCMPLRRIGHELMIRHQVMDGINRDTTIHVDDDHIEAEPAREES